RGAWRYTSSYDLKTIIKAVTLIIFLFLTFNFIVYRLEAFPRSVIIINWFILIFMLGGSRFLYRSFMTRISKEERKNLIPILIIGSGQEVVLFLRTLQMNDQILYRALAILSEDERIGHSTIQGVKIAGSWNKLDETLKTSKKKKKP